MLRLSMEKILMKLLLLLAAFAGELLAQTLEGTWQGTLIPPNQTDGIRLAFKIDKNGNAYQGTFYNLANGRQLNTLRLGKTEVR